MVDDGGGGGAVNRLCSYLCSNSVERESQETHKREKGEWKQSQVQDNDKVKCALNGSVQSQRDKAQLADKVCTAEGNGRSGKALGMVLPSTLVWLGTTNSPAPPAGGMSTLTGQQLVHKTEPKINKNKDITSR